MSKKTSVKGINQAIAEDFFYDLGVLGIVSTLPIYTFLHYIEHHFSFRFTINIQKSKEKHYDQRVCFFETYEYYDRLRQLEYYIYVNEIQDKYLLLPEAKSVQFLWGIKGWGNIEKNEYIEQLSTALMQIPKVQYVGKIDNTKIINKPLLLF